ncbi:Replication factor A protein 1 [Coemansia biformis]|uniref:Replication protein A subunit n=1 Tax=Coemansia biformis TaxID=1286918 RepID=A0A9W8CXN2_9FUNG|nr:Replication factor A protein 1 [Coemansia biformis]
MVILPLHLSSLADEQKICRYTVLRIDKCSVTRKLRTSDGAMAAIIIAEADVLDTVAEKIGNPEKVLGSAAGSAIPAPSAPPAPPPAQQQPQQQQQPSFGGSSFMNRVEEAKPAVYGGGGSGAAPIVQPIKDLNPYHNRWTIRARVTQKSAVKTWNKPTSQGRLFSVNLLDESGEIRATAFTQQVDRLYSLFEVGKVYYISNAQVKMARQQFSNVNNQYELTFEDSTTVELCTDNGNVPQEQFNFVALSSLMKFEKGNMVDVLCVLQQVGEATEITPKSGDRKMTKRDLTVVDKSGYQVRTTLWGADATGFELAVPAVVAFKGVRVGDFGGRTLSLPSTGTMTANPDIPEAHMLRGWYDSAGRTMAFQTFDGSGGMGGSGAGGDLRHDAGEVKTMAQVRDENLGGSEEKSDFFTVKGTIAFIRSSSLAYPGCASGDCSKKVTENSSGKWWCEKCQREFAAPAYRYLFSVNVSDYTGQCWLQCFNETGEKLLGCSATEAIRLQGADEAAFAKLIADATFKEFRFRCRARSERFNDNVRVRTSVVGMNAIDYVAEAQRLSALIEAMQ